MEPRIPIHTGRSLKIDALRGCAVLGMVLAHALFFFHNNTNPTLLAFENILNTTVFTVFVFVFGQSLSRWLDTHAHTQARQEALSILKRAGVLYLVYAVTATTAVLTSHLPPARILSSLIGALSVMSPPNFTEYLPLFIIITLLLFPLRQLLRFTRQSLLLTFVIGAFAYLIGVTIYPMKVPSFLLGIKALFAGSGTLLRFPVLYYFPVMLWGLWWQHDTDHKIQNKPQSTTHLYLMAGSVLLAVGSVFFSQRLNIPVLNPSNRWPPSVGFLSIGMGLATIGILLMPAFAWTGNAAKRILGYYGRDAFDIWVNHLLLLFLYREFIGTRYTDVTTVILLTAVLLAASTLLSSMIVINRIVFPFKIAFEGSTRFRKRYIAYAILALIALAWSTSRPTTSPYGNFMLSPAFIIQQTLPPTARATISSSQQWYIKHDAKAETLDLTLRIMDGNTSFSIDPNTVRIRMNGETPPFSAIAASDKTIHYTKPISDIHPGTYRVSAIIDNGGSALESNLITIHISEPLLVAWTFDWEGFDAPDSAILSMAQFVRQNPTLHFTHFVNPRMFLPGVLPQSRSDVLKQFLLGRFALGDEIAMHIHMQFDLVRAAGVTPKTANAWGLMTNEGYDVPTTNYTVDEFRQIVSFAQKLATESGLPSVSGYRAGGWFLSSAQLATLAPLGFTYDSSGRDRPTTGSFRNIPWNLEAGAQPYYPDDTGILEIPNNGLNTYEMTAAELKNRISAVYTGGILTHPTTLVFVSHPQFFSSEFYKIPNVLSAISTMSAALDKGPALFVTTSDISSIWNSSKK